MLLNKNIFSRLNYGFLGAGAMCQALCKGFLEQANIPKKNIFLSSRSENRLRKLANDLAVHPVRTNEELLSKAQVIFLCVKPQDASVAMEALAGRFSPEQTLISVMAGVPLSALVELVSCKCRLVRMMPNMPASIGQGLFGYSVLGEDKNVSAFVEELFSPLGIVLPMQEKDMGVFTVASSCGVGFVLELMQYWSEWLHSAQFSEDQAKLVTMQTFLGAALLAIKNPKIPLTSLQNRVASKGGMTAAGLRAFADAGLDTILRIGFEKSVLCERKLHAALKLSGKN